jgi:hypothetical protein
MSVLSRRCSLAWTSASAIGVTARPRLALVPSARAGERVSSISVFHSPHPPQRPSHRALWCPQEEQTNIELERGITPR